VVAVPNVAVVAPSLLQVPVCPVRAANTQPAATTFSVDVAAVGTNVTAAELVPSGDAACVAQRVSEDNVTATFSCGVTGMKIGDVGSLEFTVWQSQYGEIILSLW